MEAQSARKPVVDQIFGDNKAPLVAVLEADFAEQKAEIEAFVGQMREAAKSQPKTDEDQAALGKLILEARRIYAHMDFKRETEKRPILDAGRTIDGWFKDTLAGLIKGRDFLQDMADQFVRQKAADARAKAIREAEDARQKADAEREKAEAAKTPVAAGRAEGKAEALDARAEGHEATASAASADLVRSRVGGVTASATGTWKARIDDYGAAIGPLGSLGAYLKEDAVQAALNSMAKVQKGRSAWPGVVFYQETKANFRA